MFSLLNIRLQVIWKSLGKCILNEILSDYLNLKQRLFYHSQLLLSFQVGLWFLAINWTVYGQKMEIEDQRTWFKSWPGLSIKMILTSNISPPVKLLHSKWIFFPESKMKYAFRLARLATHTRRKKEDQKMKGMNLESKESSLEIYFACASWNLFLVPGEHKLLLSSLIYQNCQVSQAVIALALCGCSHRQRNSS